MQAPSTTRIANTSESISTSFDLIIPRDSIKLISKRAIIIKLMIMARKRIRRPSHKYR